MIVIITAFLTLAGTAAERNASAGNAVDVLLVIALDVSASVDNDEFDLQREGFARALSSPHVAKAITRGSHKSIAVSVVLWSGFIEQRLAIDWERISDFSDLSQLADRIRQIKRRYNGGATDIGSALKFSQDLFASAPYLGMRRVIDIAGDGTNNVNNSPHFERDRIVKENTTINALVVSPTVPLAEYYREFVIGGDAAFVEMASDYSGFEDAMKRKLVREIGRQYLF